jgi:hypothetical protein
MMRISDLGYNGHKVALAYLDGTLIALATGGTVPTDTGHTGAVAIPLLQRLAQSSRIMAICI